MTRSQPARTSKASGDTRGTVALPTKRSGQKRRRRQPLRRCVACGARLPQPDLVRIAVDADGPISIGEGPRGSGRGTYVCPRFECWNADGLVGRIERALHTSLSDADRQKIAAYADEL